MIQFFKNVFAGIIAGVISLLFLFVIKTNIFPAVLFGALGYIAFFFIFSSPVKKTRFDKDYPPDKVFSILNEWKKKISKIYSYTKYIDKASVNSDINRIKEIVDEFIEYINKNPKTVRKTIQFMNFYLDSTLKIVKHYTDLSDHLKGSSGLDDKLKKAEQIIEKTKIIFEKQLKNLLSDDITDLDNEMTIIEEMMKMEDFD